MTNDTLRRDRIPILGYHQVQPVGPGAERRLLMRRAKMNPKPAQRRTNGDLSAPLFPESKCQAELFRPPSAPRVALKKDAAVWLGDAENFLKGLPKEPIF